MDLIEKLIKAAQTVKTEEELCATFESLVAELGFNRWAYSIPKGPKACIQTNYDTEWAEYYMANRYDKIDPVVDKGNNFLLPYQWSSCLKQASLTKQQKKLFDEASEFELIDGLAVPIHDMQGQYANVTLVTDQTDPFLMEVFEDKGPELLSLSLLFHGYLRDFSSKSSEVKVNLTSRETECLQWAALGKTSWEIGQILKISERTAIYHIENVKKKFKATTRQQAIALAIQCQLIEFA